MIEPIPALAHATARRKNRSRFVLGNSAHHRVFQDKSLLRIRSMPTKQRTNKNPNRGYISVREPSQVGEAPVCKFLPRSPVANAKAATSPQSIVYQLTGLHRNYSGDMPGDCDSLTVELLRDRLWDLDWARCSSTGFGQSKIPLRLLQLLREG
jgi:hypothetical protein